MEQKIYLSNGYEISSVTAGTHLISVNNFLQKLLKLRGSIKPLTLLICAFLLPGLGVAQNTEIEKIKKVIEAETQAYYKADGNAWQSTWLHDAAITRAFINSSSYSITTGWENFGPEELTIIKQRKPDTITLNLSNFRVKMDGSLSWAEYDQLITPVGDTANKYSSHEYRVLEKKAGEWKIFSQVTMDMSTYEFTPVTVENNFNTVGYRFIEQNKLKEAIEVFQMNVKLYPGAWNTYDSLGEAYALAGQKDLAIKNYQRSVELNPKNEGGIAALAKLKLK